MIADTLLFTTIIIVICNLGVTCIYCKYMKYRTLDNNLFKSEDVIEKKERPLKKSRISGKLFSYLYGLTRYNSIWIGQIPSHRIRKFLYSNVLCMKIDKKAVIYGGCEIRSPWNISIGRSTIGVGCILDGRYGIEIRDSACLGGNVKIWTAQHNVNDPYFSTKGKCGKVIIEPYVWVASCSTILPNTILHIGAVIASNGVVTKDVEAYTICGGVPAKKIGERNSKLKYLVGGKDYWHFY